MEEPRRSGALLDLALVNKAELLGHLTVSGSLGCSDREMVELRMQRGGSRAKSRTTALASRTADFNLVRDLFGRIPWAMALERRGVLESYLIFMDHLLQAQERSLPTRRKSSKGSRSPAWMSEELLTELRHGKVDTRGGGRGR